MTRPMSFIESAGVRGAIVIFSKRPTGLLATTPNGETGAA